MSIRLNVQTSKRPYVYTAMRPCARHSPSEKASHRIFFVIASDEYTAGGPPYVKNIQNMILDVRCERRVSTNLNLQSLTRKPLGQDFREILLEVLGVGVGGFGKMFTIVNAGWLTD